MAVFRFNTKDGSIEEAPLMSLRESGSLGTIIAKTKFSGEFEVSTVFLAIDHQYGDGPPLVFETMVFGDSGDPEYTDEYQNRYSSVDEALADHDLIVATIQSRANGFIEQTYRWQPGKPPQPVLVPTCWERLLADELGDD